MLIRLAAPCTHESVVDGTGLRMVVWTQGCPHDCKGCHNPQTHDINGGFWVPVKRIIREFCSNERLFRMYHGITISGGEPFLQPEACAEIAKKIKNFGKSVWVYTGYTIEQLLAAKREDWLELLQYTDVLVDGPFIQEKRSLDLAFRGSSNQRIIPKQEFAKYARKTA
ncbi:anaerobic ribonucleoside-triphosphate reductase activating protein [Thermanaerosceptrum fracticalcis]|uniref:Anaerobic ribonucleoside-triphosphate reductase-activating protein n=1 Tax=Thermanaerosceptrum fracticalcis TaxID=1712410 RepID=A0A7G6E054_THEFR|nr:anaerobic ribonucleoside-triphosphate reductase activating protein [Thermanaerosceptrum fracticalcis]QNB45458.1 anaerobic ribonucleoside-triphosphate reductase activating protein [Thermanaerosceptrum fracticalcis]